MTDSTIGKHAFTIVKRRSFRAMASSPVYHYGGGTVLVSQDVRTTSRSTGQGIRAATQSVGGSGTKYVGGKKVKVLQVGDKSATIRDKATGEPAAVRLLSRVEQLRLLSKAEKAGLLSAAENAGFSLSSIEKLGLLSKAEEFGALSAATDPKTPSLLLLAAFGLLLLGPAFVYFVPEDSTTLVVLQALVALVSVLGGTAAYAASSFVSALQSSE